jgi:hypothetical protein
MTKMIMLMMIMMMVRRCEVGGGGWHVSNLTTMNVKMLSNLLSYILDWVVLMAVCGKI